MPDYTARPLSFKVKKALRYTRMYGVRRTLSIIRGQYNMKRTHATLPAVAGQPGKTGKHVGLIGCGIFGFGVVGYFLEKNQGKVIRAVLDNDANRAASFYQRYGLDYYTTDPDRFFSDPEIDLVYIASDHLSHAEYAIRALELGCDVLIEKPLTTSVEDCDRVIEAAARLGRRAGVNHSLLGDPQVRRVLDLVREGRLGTPIGMDLFYSSDYPPYHGGPLPPQYRDGSAIPDRTGWRQRVYITWVTPSNPAQTSNSDSGLKRIRVTIERNSVVLADRSAFRSDTDEN